MRGEPSGAVNPVARGLAPVRLRSSRKTIARGVLDTSRWQVLGPLRSPTGASSLATKSIPPADLAVWRRFRQFDVIEHPVHRQLGQHDDLLDSHGSVPVGTFQAGGKEIGR